MISDYVCEIIYHTVKENIVANVLSRKAPKVLVRGRYMRIELVSTILEQIRSNQVEAMKPENVQEEKL